jgi:hypothetical protein
MAKNIKKAQTGADSSSILWKGPDRLKRVSKNSVISKGPDKKGSSSNVRPTKYKSGGRTNKKK